MIFSVFWITLSDYFNSENKFSTQLFKIIKLYEKSIITALSITVFI
jgi:hypothetical protein